MSSENYCTLVGQTLSKPFTAGGSGLAGAMTTELGGEIQKIIVPLMLTADTISAGAMFEVVVQAEDDDGTGGSYTTVAQFRFAWGGHTSSNDIFPPVYELDFGACGWLPDTAQEIAVGNRTRQARKYKFYVNMLSDLTDYANIAWDLSVFTR